MASASALSLSSHRSKSNPNVNNNNDHQPNWLRQLRRGNCHSVSLSHLAPLKGIHAHEAQHPLQSASLLSPLKDTPQDAGNQEFSSYLHKNVFLPLEIPTPAQYYFAPICPVPLPPLYGLPVVQDDIEEEFETNGTPCKRQCYRNGKFDSCNVISHQPYTCSSSNHIFIFLYSCSAFGTTY